MKSALPASAAVPPFRWQRITWASALLAALVLGGVAWRDAMQRRDLAAGEAAFARVLTARMELARGFLHLSLSGDELSAFDRAQGRALVRQALDTFEAVRGDPRFAPLAPGGLGPAIAELQATLAPDADGPEDLVAHRQIAWRIVELEVQRFSDAGKAHLRRAVARHDAEFNAAIALAAVLLTAAATGGFMATRARRARRAALREAEQRWILAIDGAGHGVWELDFAHGTAYHSVRLKTMFGFAEGDEAWDTAEPWSSRVHPDDRPAVLAALEAHVSGAEPKYRSEHRARCRDGTWLWVLAQGMAVERDAAGRATRVIGTLTDISELRRITGELEENRQLLESRVAERTAELQAANVALASRAEVIADLYNNVPCGYHSLDGEGVFVAINDTELRWLGRERDEVVGRLRFRDVITPESVLLFEARFPEFLRRGEVRDLEFDLVRTDGSTMAVVLSATATYDEQGRFVRSRSTLFDDRERRQRARVIDALNAELQRRAAEAESASRAKTAFLANMSHEIRTPMNAIIGLTHLLRRDTREPAQLERLDKVAAAADHLLAVINDILDLSKIEAGHVTLTREPVDLEAIVGNVAQMIGDRAEAKGIEIVAEVDSALPEGLTGDPVRLSQALLNYAGNAVKFTQRGSIVLRLRSLGSDDGGVLVRFEVQDTGVGIDARHHERLFRAFEQADSSTTRQHGGTGLGLAINARLARLMGGEVGVDSAPGTGSTFWMTARLGRRPAGPADVSEGAPALRGVRAIVVDTRPEAARAIAAMLAGLGAEVDTIAALPARGAVASGVFDLALVDCRAIPEGLADGARLREVLAARVPARVFLTSAAAHDDARTLAQDWGLDGALAKPLLPALLRAALRAAPGSGDRAPAAGPGPSVAGDAIPGALSGRHVLLVEDNPINQEVSTALLEHAGLAVDLARNGEEAVRAARGRVYDLVLMDVQMPVMDGLAATRALRLLPGWGTVPIVAMTANAFSEDRALCLAAGMNDHLGKPVDADILYGTLLRWLAPGEAAPPATGRRAVPGADDLPWTWPDLPGIDVAAGLQFANGREDVYRRRFLRFLRSPGADVALLEAALDGAEAEDARRWAHSLKGAAGFLGAARLRGLAEDLEAALAAGTWDLGEVDRLRRAVAAEIDTLRRAVATLADGAAGGADERSVAAMRQLRELLAQDDMRANAVLREARDALKRALGDRFSRLDDEVSRFDYAAALATLESARRDA